mmetsp:Transcript_26487/g.61014  ORF Transcript_26487/g.61014 Transcript_26487/m.61014 type:complete len:150 (-) Transcript_26487:295-744(-)
MLFRDRLHDSLALKKDQKTESVHGLPCQNIGKEESDRVSSVSRRVSALMQDPSDAVHARQIQNDRRKYVPGHRDTEQEWTEVLDHVVDRAVGAIIPAEVPLGLHDDGLPAFGAVVGGVGSRVSLDVLLEVHWIEVYVEDRASEDDDGEE